METGFHPTSDTMLDNKKTRLQPCLNILNEQCHKAGETENSKIHVVNKAYKGNAMVTKDNQIKRNMELYQLHMYNPQQKCWEG